MANNIIKSRLFYLTNKSYQEKMRWSVSEKVSAILDEAERVASSGDGVYFIKINTPSQEIIDELVSIGLAVYVDKELCTVSWWTPEE